MNPLILTLLVVLPVSLASPMGKEAPRAEDQLRDLEDGHRCFRPWHCQSHSDCIKDEEGVRRCKQVRKKRDGKSCKKNKECRSGLCKENPRNYEKECTKQDEKKTSNGSAPKVVQIKVVENRERRKKNEIQHQSQQESSFIKISI